MRWIASVFLGVVVSLGCGASGSATNPTGGGNSGATSTAAQGGSGTSTAGTSTGAASSGSSRRSTSGGSSGGGATSGASATTGGPGTSGGSGTGTAPTGLHVAGGHIVDGNGNILQLHGADETGSQTNCSYQAGGSASLGFPGFFDMPNDQAGVAQMLAWHINAVRVPLNEDCWLGLNGLPFGGSTAANYQSAIVQFVNLLNANGLVVIVDLHWAGPGTTPTNPTLGQIPMADADHSVDFWTSVAQTFASNSSVIFDLYNEPNITDWGCWVSGAAASANCAKANGTSYAVAGMATLLQAVQKAGASNVAILGGLAYSQDFSQWVTSVQGIPTLASPLDGISIANVAASWHAYDFNSAYTQCPSQYNQPPYSSNSCATAQQFASSSGITGVLSAGFPVVVGEMGLSAFSASTASKFSATQIAATEGWLDGLMTYLEGQGQGYLAWSWDLDQDPVLITDFTTGAPTQDFGVTYQVHLQSL